MNCSVLTSYTRALASSTGRYPSGLAWANPRGLRGLCSIGLLVFISGLAGCSTDSGTTSNEQGSAGISDQQDALIDNGFNDVSQDQGVGELIQSELESVPLEDRTNIEPPAPLFSATSANLGVHLALTTEKQRSIINVAMVEQQWQAMQTCLAVSGTAPIVILTEGPANPLTRKDDVIHSIEGIPIATSTRTATPIVQVSESDFDSGNGNPGFHLRSIMGRLLWLTAGLPAREYPFSCASQQSTF